MRASWMTLTDILTEEIGWEVHLRQGQVGVMQPWAKESWSHQKLEAEETRNNFPLWRGHRILSVLTITTPRFPCDLRERITWILELEKSLEKSSFNLSGHTRPSWGENMLTCSQVFLKLHSQNISLNHTRELHQTFPSHVAENWEYFSSISYKSSLAAIFFESFFNYSSFFSAQTSSILWSLPKHISVTLVWIVPWLFIPLQRELLESRNCASLFPYPQNIIKHK